MPPTGPVTAPQPLPAPDCHPPRPRPAEARTATPKPPPPPDLIPGQTEIELIYVQPTLWSL